MVSVTSDVAIGSAYQMAAPKPAQPDPIQTAGSFATLVGNSLSANQPNSPPPAEPLPPPASHNVPEPPSSSSRTSSARETSTASQSPANATANPPGNSATAANADADAGPSAINGKAAPIDAKGTGSKPAGTKSNDKNATDDSSAGDQTSTEMGGTPATTLTGAGILIAVAAQAAPVNAAMAAPADSNAPLAIAAAAIAASASTPAGLSAQSAATSMQGAGQELAFTADGFATAAAKPTVSKTAGQATTETAPAEPQLVGTDLAAPTEGGLTAAAATASATATKTSTTGFKAAPATVQTKATAGISATETSEAGGSSTAPTTVPQAPLAPQSGVAATANGPNTPVDALISNGGSGPPSPSPSAAATRDHTSISPDTQAVTVPTDATTPAAAVMQGAPPVAPQVAPAHMLTVTPGIGAPVPLGGLAVEIAASAHNGKTRFELRLEPADLGRIDVRIDVDRNGQVTSRLTVEKPETLAILQQDAPQLQQALNDAGLKTGGGGLQFSLRDQSSYGSGQNGNNNSTSGNAQQLVISEDETIQAALAGQLYGRMSGTSAGVDIRV